MSSVWTKVIVHADMDAFYAAVEQLDDPALRGKPVLVGPKSGRGVVLTASYEARPARVGSAMPMSVAIKRCPDAVVVPPRFERYQEISRQVMAIFRDFSPRVEPISLDEAFLDMSGCEHIFGKPPAIGRQLKDAIRDTTGGLTASVGISASKYVAKVASAYQKPDGLTVVVPDDVVDWLAPQPVSVLWGAGPKTQAKLSRIGMRTVGDVAGADEAELVARLGAAGGHFYRLAHGLDPRRVQVTRKAKSLSSERTLNADVKHREDVEFHVKKACEQVARRLRRQDLTAGGLRVKLRRSDFKILTRQRLLSTPSNATRSLTEAAISLLPAFGKPGPLRLIGVAAINLANDNAEAQLGLLDSAVERDRRLDAVKDQLDRRFGHGTVRRARELERETVLDTSPNLDSLTENGTKAQS